MVFCDVTSDKPLSAARLGAHNVPLGPHHHRGHPPATDPASGRGLSTKLLPRAGGGCDTVQGLGTIQTPGHCCALISCLGTQRDGLGPPWVALFYLRRTSFTSGLVVRDTFRPMQEFGGFPPQPSHKEDSAWHRSQVGKDL